MVTILVEQPLYSVHVIVLLKEKLKTVQHGRKTESLMKSDKILDIFFPHTHTPIQIRQECTLEESTLRHAFGKKRWGLAPRFPAFDVYLTR